MIVDLRGYGVTRDRPGGGYLTTIAGGKLAVTPSSTPAVHPAVTFRTFKTDDSVLDATTGLPPVPSPKKVTGGAPLPSGATDTDEDTGAPPPPEPSEPGSPPAPTAKGFPWKWIALGGGILVVVIGGALIVRRVRSARRK